jgi:hypothetical protein
MPYFLLTIALQVAFVVHIIRTGRSTTWIWVVVMLPMAGAIAYFVMEVLPDLLGTRTARTASRVLQNSLNPQKELQSARHNYEISQNLANATRLAEELLAHGLFDEAKTLCQYWLSGSYANDPQLLCGLARAEFGLENFAATCACLDQLILHNPDYKNANAHLLYARAQQAVGNTAKALQEFNALVSYFPGPEAKYYCALLHKEQGNSQQAKVILLEILHVGQRSGRHYRDFHGEWLRKAKAALATL